MAKGKIKIKSLSLILISCFCFFGTLGLKKPVQAGYWGEAMAAELLSQAWTEAREAFKESMLSSLKQEASNLIRDRVKVLLTGRGGSGSLIITDYDDFIYGGAREESRAYMRDFFRVLGDGVGDSTAVMYDEIEDSLLSPGSELSTIDQYVQGGLDNIFDPSQGGGAQAIVAMATNDANNPFGVHMRAQQILESKEAQAQKKAEIEAVAGKGFVSQKDSENNLINLPGSVLSGITVKAESMYMDTITQAGSIPEIIGTVAAGMLSKTIESGIVKVTSPIDKQLKNIHDETEGGIMDIQRDIYGGFGTLK